MIEVDSPRRILSAPASPAEARRRPNAVAALQAGLLGAVVAFALQQAFAVLVYDESFWYFFRMIAAMVRGPAVLEPDDEFDAAIVLLGSGLYLAISLLYALALCTLVADTPRRYSGIMGLAFGLALYFANFHGFTALFPWFISHRTWDTLLVHGLFGAMVARSYWMFRKLNPGQTRFFRPA
jgi:hypothetical protein